MLDICLIYYHCDVFTHLSFNKMFVFSMGFTFAKIVGFKLRTRIKNSTSKLKRQKYEAVTQVMTYGLTFRQIQPGWTVLFKQSFKGIHMPAVYALLSNK